MIVPTKHANTFLLLSPSAGHGSPSHRETLYKQHSRVDSADGNWLDSNFWWWSDLLNTLWPAASPSELSTSWKRSLQIPQKSQQTCFRLILFKTNVIQKFIKQKPISSQSFKSNLYPQNCQFPPSNQPGVGPLPPTTRSARPTQPPSFDHERRPWALANQGILGETF